MLPVEVGRQPRLQQVALGRAQREAAPPAPPEVQQAHRVYGTLIAVICVLAPLVAASQPLVQSISGSRKNILSCYKQQLMLVPYLVYVILVSVITPLEKGALLCIDYVSRLSEPVRQKILVVGGTSGLGKALVRELSTWHAVEWTSGPRSGGIDLRTEAGISAVLRKVPEVDLVVLNAGVHSRSIDDNYLTNLSAPLRIVRHVAMHSKRTKVVYVGSRAARFASNTIGRLYATDNSYGISKLMMTSVMVQLITKGKIQGLVWAPPAMKTGIRSSSQVEPNSKVWDHAKWMAKIVGALDHVSEYPVWEYGFPCSWRPDVDRALRWLKQNYKVNRGFLLGSWLAETSSNYAGQVSLSCAAATSLPRSMSSASRRDSSDSCIEFPSCRSEALHLIQRGYRIVGAMHSYDPSHFTGTKFFSLVDCERTLKLEGTELVVGAGVSIYTAVHYAEKRGRTLYCVGSHGSQSLVAALAMGTHGDARTMPTMAEAITAMEMSDPVQPRWINDESTLRLQRVLPSGVVWTVRLQTMPLHQPCVIQRWFSRALPVHQLAMSDFAKANRLAGGWMIHTVDYVPPSQYIQHKKPEEVSVFPMTIGYYWEDILRRIAKTLKPLVALSPRKMCTSATISTSVRYSGSSTPIEKMIGDLAHDVDHLMNSEFAVDIMHAESVIRIMDAIWKKYPTMEYKIRFGGRTDRAVHALNYGRDTLFVDVHFPRRIADKLPTDIFRSLPDPRVHMGKLQPRS